MSATYFVFSRIARHRGHSVVGCRINLLLVEQYLPYDDMDESSPAFGIMFTCMGGSKYYWVYPDEASRNREYFRLNNDSLNLTREGENHVV